MRDAIGEKTAVRWLRKLPANVRRPIRQTIGPRIRPGNIVMIHMGRVGSSVVGDMLNQHPRISWKGEILRKPSLEASGRQIVDAETFEQLRPSTQFDPIRVFRKMEQRAGYGCYLGCEILPYQFEFSTLPIQDYLDFLESTKPTYYITLRRRNLLRRLVSLYLGRNKKIFHVSKTDSAPTLQTIYINPEKVFSGQHPQPTEQSLIESFEDYEHIYDDIFRTLDGRPVLSLWFEDDVEPGPAKAYDKVLDFVGVEHAPATVNRQRATPWPLSQLIENYDEVVAYLRGTPYEWMTAD